MAEHLASDPSSQILSHNRSAMESLKSGDFSTAFSLLKQAESHLHPSLPSLWKLQAITYNNLGCFFKKARDHSNAMTYLQQALRIELDYPEDYTNVAGTYLNLCAVFSMVNRHKQALRQAQRALQVLKAHFQRSPNLVTTMAIAYHNIGVEFEYLRLRKPASEAYYDGWDFSSKELGPSHPLTSSLKRSFNACMEQRPLLEPPIVLPPVDYGSPWVGGNKQKSAIRDKVSPLFHREWEALPLVSSRSDERKRAGERSFGETIGTYSLQKAESQGPGERTARQERKPKEPEGSGKSRRRRNLSKVSVGEKEEKGGIAATTIPSAPSPSKATTSVPKSAASPPPPKSATKAAIVIQRFVRGFTARQKLRHLKDQQQHNKIQAAEELAKKALEEVEKLREELKQARKHGESKEKRKKGTGEDGGRRRKAATVIQAAVRMFLALRRFQRQRAAILLIQRGWRMASVRFLYHQIRNAIIFIQACYRGYRARKLVKSQHQKSRKSAKIPGKRPAH